LASSTETPAPSAKRSISRFLYGISRWGLAGRLGVTADEAQAIIDRYFERFPGSATISPRPWPRDARRRSPPPCSAAKTHFPRHQVRVQHESQGAERAAINAPIQGTSADIIKRAMVRMWPALEREARPGRGC
jgi:DNA polymerase-1